MENNLIVPNAMLLNAAYFLMSVTVLWVLVFVCWRSYKSDAFKQDLFQLKAELFDLAMSGKIDFSHPSYKLLQNRIEALMTWAPRLTTTHYVIALLFRNSYSSLLRNRWDKPESGHPMSKEIVAIHHWLLLRAFCQALNIPAFILPSTRVVWGLSKPVSQSINRIERTVDALQRARLLDPVRLLVREAVEAKELQDAATAAKAAVL